MSSRQYTSEELHAIRLYQAARGDDIPKTDPLRREILFYMDQASDYYRRGADKAHVIAKLTEIRDTLGHGMPDEILRELATDTHEIGGYEDGDDDCPHDLIANCDGMMALMMQHILETAPRQQEWLSLAAVVSVMSVLLAQKVQTVTGTRTNLYVLAVARPSSGKDHPRQKAKQLLSLAGGDFLVGPENINSGSGMLHVLKKQPSVLFAVDEFGKVLQSVNSKEAQALAREVLTYLLTLWSSTAITWRANALKKEEDCVTIAYPCVSLMGSTVPDSFWKAITRESMADGFLSRILPFETRKYPEMTLRPITEPPVVLIDGMRRWIEYAPSGNLTANTAVGPRVMQFTPEAERLYLEFFRRCDSLVRDMADSDGAPLWGRAAEKASKLALIHTCSRSFEATEIDTPAMRWGIDLVEFCTDRFLTSAKRWLADNKTEEFTNRVFRIIEGAGPGGIGKHELSRKTQWLNSRERLDVIANLQDAGRIMAVERSNDGRTKVIYLAV